MRGSPSLPHPNFMIAHIYPQPTQECFPQKLPRTVSPVAFAVANCVSLLSPAPSSSTRPTQVEVPKASLARPPREVQRAIGTRKRYTVSVRIVEGRFSAVGVARRSSHVRSTPRGPGTVTPATPSTLRQGVMHDYLETSKHFQEVKPGPDGTWKRRDRHVSARHGMPSVVRRDRQTRREAGVQHSGKFSRFSRLRSHQAKKKKPEGIFL